MSLLNDLWSQPIDGDYAQAARSPSSRPVALTRSGVVLVVAVLLGVVLSGAVVSLQGPTAALKQARQLLVEQVLERTRSADELAADNDALSAQIAELQDQVLGGRDPAMAAELQAMELVSGAAAAAGPGLQIELSDAAQSGTVDPETLVQDGDLQTVVNGLWAAGAEAIAVNGQRITGLSAIRNVGPAVLVNLRPLSSPYLVEAIGDPAELQTGFARTVAATQLALLSSQYGIGVQTRTATELVLPGVGGTTLRHASVPDVASSSPNDEEDSP